MIRGNAENKFLTYREKTSAKDVRFWIELGANVNTQDFSGQTPLFLAVVNGHTDSAKAVLEAGANPNTNCYIYSAAPISYTQDSKMIDLLKKHGAKPSSVRIKVTKTKQGYDMTRLSID